MVENWLFVDIKLKLQQQQKMEGRGNVFLTILTHHFPLPPFV